MRRFLILSLLALGHFQAAAQYYYKDIVSNQSANADMEAYRAQKVRSIRINSFESNGAPSEGFFCEKKFSKNYQKAELYTRSSVSSKSLLISYFNDKGQLVESSDSSEIVVNRIRYTYDPEGRISSIVSHLSSSDDDFLTQHTEEHRYTYDAAGKPSKMIRIKNHSDSTVILFSLDESGNVAIEKDSKTGGKYYYYYDTRNRLTDIVHMNEFKQEMIPDYQFEYNNANQVVQMMSVEDGGKDYVTWKYQYAEGLRARERVYSKEGRLLGSIEYEYDKK